MPRDAPVAPYLQRSYNALMAAASTEWFLSLRNDYIATAKRADYAAGELASLDEVHRFSFYRGLNPMWLMDHAERGGMYLLMTTVRPRVIIEIGSRFAGATSLFSSFAEHVYVLDIDPPVKTRCAPLPNVTVTIGDSSSVLPRLLDEINRKHGGWEFALVDGDHSTEGVRKDLDSLIASRPLRRAFITMHDSFNPECRAGIKAASWDRPWVHHVEVDFTIGNLMPQPFVYGQMWGGLALAEIASEDRTCPLRITESGRLSYEAAARHQQKLSHRPLYKRLAGKFARLIGA